MRHRCQHHIERSRFVVQAGPHVATGREPRTGAAAYHPTPEEQAALARWSGWGAIPQIFDEPLHPYTVGLMRCVPSLEGERQHELPTIRAGSGKSDHAMSAEMPLLQPVSGPRVLNIRLLLLRMAPR